MARWSCTGGRRPWCLLPGGVGLIPRACCDSVAAVPSVLVAPDSFKGTFSAVEAAEAMARGLERAGLEADLCPVADGGEGTMSVLLTSIGGREVDVEATDPLGRPMTASFALLGDGRRALVETAAASGLALISENERDPWATTTYGTGQLIRAAVEAGAREVMVAVGGSATMDGGRGALEAVADGGGVGDARIVVLSDVQTTWEDCSRIFGPQKGADEEMVGRLEQRLDQLAAELPRDPRGVAMTGAAGGLSGGLWAGLGAELQPGAPYVLDAVRFDDRLGRVDAVIAGEGQIDEQSVLGKIVGEIGERAVRAGVPLYAIVGSDAVPRRGGRADRPALGARGDDARGDRGDRRAARARGRGGRLMAGARVVASLPLTGPAAPLGRDVLRGAELALARADDAGVELEALDSYDHHDRDERAAENAERAAGDARRARLSRRLPLLAGRGAAPRSPRPGLLAVAPVATYAGCAATRSSGSCPTTASARGPSRAGSSSRRRRGARRPRPRRRLRRSRSGRCARRRRARPA